MTRQNMNCTVKRPNVVKVLKDTGYWEEYRLAHFPLLERLSSSLRTPNAVGCGTFWDPKSLHLLDIVCSIISISRADDPLPVVQL